MLYEFWENFKIKIYNFLNPEQPFVPAGVTPLAEPTTEKSGFSFDSLKPTNLKDLSFETKRLLVLGFTFLTALVVLAVLKSSYTSYSSARATAPTPQTQSISQSPEPTTLSEPPIDD